MKNESQSHDSGDNCTKTWDTHEYLVTHSHIRACISAEVDNIIIYLRLALRGVDQVKDTMSRRLRSEGSRGWILKIFALLLFIARFRWPGNISALFFTLIGKVKRKLVTRYEIMRISQQLPAAPCISLFGQGQCNNKKRKIQIKPFLYSPMQTAIDGNNNSKE